MAVTIIDTPVNVTRYLPRLGDVEVVIRYITRTAPNGAKHIKLPEVRAIKAAGKKLCIVYEAYGDFAHAGHGGISGLDGAADGRYARSIMPKLGAPAGAVVYFAVDHDATQAQMNRNVLPYFQALQVAFADGEYRVGVYGPGAVCNAVIAAGFAEIGWLSNAKGWKGYAAFKSKAALVQGLPTHIAGGLDIDPNIAQVDDFGQFDPFSQDASLDPVVTADGNNDTEPRRLGAGEDTADAHEAWFSADDAPTDAGGALSTLKMFVRSKIAWLAGSLGGGSAASAVTSDPDTMGALEHLFHKPSFWLAIMALVVAGMVLYYHWRDHRAGAGL